MVRQRLYHTEEERIVAHRARNNRHYARERKRQREAKQGAKKSLKSNSKTTSKPESLDMSQLLRLASRFPQQIHRIMAPDPHSYLDALFLDLRSQNTQGLDKTLKMLGKLRTKADSFWSRMVELEGTVSSPDFKQYEAYKEKVYQAIRWAENLWIASMEKQDLVGMRARGEFLFQIEKGSI
ncbi:hypothetical protein C8J56DRAFT_886154 [Mycena floridula]|nr:hypothetical protein C8J56DRAFT_886154 [Mycena floridula]